ncbi:TnsA endonuclease N-terminal domain-containing protein [Variovorax sp. LT2P21]|uniref:TnsA endonuclease N-terminal domain-containing protein n=1 Tax=Variovorax sp. LT2P21 TaxID=3443731 RepID=UPI003F477332
MAKRRYAMDEEKIARFHKEKRGEGEGAEYKPFLTIHDVPSHGLSSRVLGRKTGRLHHVLSKLERAALLIYDWEDSVDDLREQFPLDREETRRIAEKMGVKHPRDTQTGVDIVMTTDLVVTISQDGQRSLLARAVKPANDLGNTRVLEKLEIERRYWTARQVAWAVITEHDISATRVGNLEWLLEMRSLDRMVAPHPHYWHDRCHQFLHALTHAQGGSMQWLCSYLEQQHGFRTGEALTVLRHLASTKRLLYDLERPFDIKAPADVFQLATGPGVDVGAGRRAA